MNIVVWKYKKMSLLKNRLIHSLFHAIVGLIHAFHRQRNLKIMLVATVLVIVAGIFLKISTIEMFIVVYAIFCVIITELINTSIELVVDLVTKEKRLKAMLAKDVAASATLIAVLQSIVIGIIILVRHI
jgi:diacylglycerol kinase (ATP)